MKKAVIFDLDGTLSDSIASMKYCGDRALAPFGYGPFPESEYKYFVGDGAANLVKRALVAAGDTELVHFEEAFALYKEYFAKDFIPWRYGDGYEDRKERRCVYSGRFVGVQGQEGTGGRTCGCHHQPPAATA